jgi:pilus assembly protein CpaB
MRMKSLILIFIALGCGLVASIGISQVMERGGSTGPAMEVEQILVALTDIDASAKLGAANVKLEDWPKSKVPEAAIRSLDEAKDKYATTRFFKGEPVLITRISDTPGGVTQKIPVGYRAEPVKVEEDTVMKAISPGDRVDVSVFLKRDGNEVGQTGIFPLLRNVQIFAVNSNTERATDEKGTEAAFRTVSLLVKEDHVGELQLAKRLGSIHLSLRGPSETDEIAGEQVTKMQELLQGKSEIGSDTAQASPAPTPGPGLNDLLSAGPAASGEPAAAWNMQVMGPNGTEEYSWSSRDALPQRSQGLTAGAGTTQSALPTPNTTTPPAAAEGETTTHEPPAAGGPEISQPAD